MQTLGSLELARLVLALTLLLVAAHTVGYLANRFGQPRVIGEIVGGLLLGPTVLGAIAPGLHDQVFPATGPVPIVLDAMYQLGLLLLMFSAGSEIRSSFQCGRTTHGRRRDDHGHGRAVPGGLGIRVAPARGSPHRHGRRSHGLRPGVRARDRRHEHPGDLAHHVRPRHPRDGVRPHRARGRRARGRRGLRAARDRARSRRRLVRPLRRPAGAARARNPARRRRSGSTWRRRWRSSGVALWLGPRDLPRACWASASTS